MAHPTALNRTQLLEKMNSGICSPALVSARRPSAKEGQDKGSNGAPERPQTRTESGHLPDLSGAHWCCATATQHSVAPDCLFPSAVRVPLVCTLPSTSGDSALSLLALVQACT